MPLLDHFHPPLKEERPWQGFHSYWANAIVERLNASLLPADYFAIANIEFGREVEVDVAAPEQERDAEIEQNGGVATAVYAPPKAALTIPVDFSELDTIEIEVRKEHALQLVGAIELISPANKVRPKNRRAFVIKCASYLQQGIGVIIVDVVTERLGNLHAELIEELAPALTIELNDDDALYAIAYRSQPAHQVEAWPERLALGRALPTLPLWLTDILAVPVELEPSYLAACKGLRIRVS